MDLNLRNVREARGMTQAELSEQSGVSRQTIISIETDEEYNVTSKTLKALANALGVDVMSLFLPGVSSKLNETAS